MVQRRQLDCSLFEVLLPDGHKLWPDRLRKHRYAARGRSGDRGRRPGAGGAKATELASGTSRHAGRGRRPDVDLEAVVRLELRGMSTTFRPRAAVGTPRVHPIPEASDPGRCRSYFAGPARSSPTWKSRLPGCSPRIMTVDAGQRRSDTPPPRHHAPRPQPRACRRPTARCTRRAARGPKSCRRWLATPRVSSPH